MIAHFIWAVALTVSVGAMFYCISQSSIEEDRQNAFMMKICTDAGGKWTTGWTHGIWWCEK